MSKRLRDNTKDADDYDQLWFNDLDLVSVWEETVSIAKNKLRPRPCVWLAAEDMVKFAEKEVRFQATCPLSAQIHISFPSLNLLAPIPDAPHWEALRKWFEEIDALHGKRGSSESMYHTEACKEVIRSALETVVRVIQSIWTEKHPKFTCSFLHIRVFSPELVKPPPLCTIFSTTAVLSPPSPSLKRKHCRKEAHDEDKDDDDDNKNNDNDNNNNNNNNNNNKNDDE